MSLNDYRMRKQAYAKWCRGMQMLDRYFTMRKRATPVNERGEPTGEDPFGEGFTQEAQREILAGKAAVRAQEQRKAEAEEKAAVGPEQPSPEKRYNAGVADAESDAYFKAMENWDAAEEQMDKEIHDRNVSSIFTPENMEKFRLKKEVADAKAGGRENWERRQALNQGVSDAQMTEEAIAQEAANRDAAGMEAAQAKAQASAERLARIIRMIKQYGPGVGIGLGAAGAGYGIYRGIKAMSDRGKKKKQQQRAALAHA